MGPCVLCRCDRVELLIDAGPQPIGNRYLRSAEEPELRHPMRVAQCPGCGVVQLVDPVPAAELVPPFDWITYNEPEGHLDDLAGRIRSLPGVGPESLVVGISYKDDTTLARLSRLGLGRTYRLDLERDLEIGEPRAGLETIQARVTPARSRELSAAHGRADVLLVRHILEHAHDPRQFLDALIELVRPGGYLVFEVPDCSRALDTADCTTLWEEHVLYFTPRTFQSAFRLAGLTPHQFLVYPYSTENSLVAIVRREGLPASEVPFEGLHEELERARRFAAELQERRHRVSRRLEQARVETGRIAIFGAGHLACTFVSMMGVEHLVDFAVDDHPAKRGLYLPGSRIPIRDSASLLEEGVGLCLLALSPESEAKVVERNQEFLRLGGQFASIFPGKSNSLRVT